MKGNQLVQLVTTSDNSLPSPTYDIRFSGNNMVLTFIYANNPSMPLVKNGTKLMEIVFEKVK